MTTSQHRTLRCTPAQRAEIRARAHAAGMTVSAYLVACALHEDAAPRDAGGPALSAAEERLLFERVEEIHGICRALLEEMPGSRVSMLGAMAFVERAVRGRQTGDQWHSEERSSTLTFFHAPYWVD